MKTHEIGIGSFASVMINGKEKYWDSRERGAGARSLFWCVWLNVHDHVHLMKKASKEARKKKEIRKNAQSAYCRSLKVVSSIICGWRWPTFMSLAFPMTAANPKTRARGETGYERRNLPENQPALSTRLCSADPWWSFQAAQTYRNYILLTARSFTCFHCLRLRYVSQTRAGARLIGPLAGERASRLCRRKVASAKAEREAERGKPAPTSMCGGKDVRQPQITVLFNTHSSVLPWWLGPALGPDSYLCVCVCRVHCTACTGGYTGM